MNIKINQMKKKVLKQMSQIIKLNILYLNLIYYYKTKFLFNI